jgi:tetratricopeptide (TPR) repeat protein
MRFWQYIHILALITVATCFVQPVCAADEATTYYNMGEAYLATGDYERAIASFDMALASDTTMIKISETLLYTYRDKSYAQIQLRRYDDAISTTGQGISLYPRDKMLWNNKGYAYYNLGKYEEAIAAYNNAITYEPDYTIALINKGDTLAKMQDTAGAVDAYTRALETDPGNQVATNGLLYAQKATVSKDKVTVLSPNVTSAQQDRQIASETLILAPLTSTTPVQQKTPVTSLPQQAQQPTRTTSLTYAPIGALVLIGGIAVWGRCQGSH